SHCLKTAHSMITLQTARNKLVCSKRDNTKLNTIISNCENYWNTMQMLRHSINKISPICRVGTAISNSSKCKEIAFAIAKRCLVSGTLDDVIIREAQIEDHGAVMAIQPNLNEGMDSLNEYFPKYLANHSYKCYVAEMHRKLLAYMQYLTVDGGHTVVICEDRVKDDVKPPEVHELLRGYTMDKIKANSPKLENIYSMRLMEDPGGLHDIGKRRWSTFRATNLTPIVWSGVKNTQLIAHDKFLDIMHDPETCEQLFPDKRIVSFWEVFDTVKGVETNISHILNQSWVYVTYTDNPVNKATIALSTGTPARCEKGLRLDIDFYGDRLDDFKSHIVAHCQRAIHYKEHHESLVPVLCFPAILDVKLVEDYCVNTLGWNSGPMSKDKPLFEPTKLHGN
ncbi:unnamed protein product, partial [Owenia fusiformis]